MLPLPSEPSIGDRMKFTIPEHSVSFTIPAYEIDIPDPVVTPPVVLPPAAFWIYHNGQFNWSGDYSWDTGPIDYAHVDTDGTKCIAVPIIKPWGGWQPYSLNFDTSKYSYLTFAVKPTQAGQFFGVGFAANNDAPDGVFIDVNGKPQYNAPSTKYGPMPQLGQWTTYKIPLADFKLTNPLILKFCIADGTGAGSNLYLLKDVGFV
jgi:hypothetical protein